MLTRNGTQINITTQRHHEMSCNIAAKGMNLPIFRATGKRASERVHIERVDRTEVTSHTAKLLSVNSVVKTCLELALTRRGGGHGLCVLSTTQQDMRVSRRDHGTVHGALGAVQPHHFEVGGINQQRGAIFAGRDHHTLVAIEVQTVHTVRVQLLALDFLARGGVVLDHEAGVEASHDVLVRNGPADARGLVVVVHRNHLVGHVQRGRVVLLCTRHCK